MTASDEYINVSAQTPKCHYYCIYIGFVVPEKMAYVHYNSFAGNEAEINFIKNVLSRFSFVCLSYTYNAFFQPKRFFRPISYFNLDDNVGVRCIGAPSIKMPFFGKFFSMIAIKMLVGRIVKKIRASDSLANINIITCNSYPLFSWPALKISSKYNLPTVCYLIDGFYYEGKANLFRRINERTAKTNLKKYKKVIALSENVLKDFCICRQRQIAITPVVFNERTAEYQKLYLDKESFNIVFAGGIAPLNGIDLYCELSSFLEPGIKLHLFGKGELSSKLTDFSHMKDNIIYHGPIEHNELMEVEKDADILIIIRPTEDSKQNAITKYGIPFKLIEYLQSGRPIVASYMEAVPECLQPYINVCEANVKDVNRMINAIKENYGSYLKKAIEAKEYMKKNCSWGIYSTVLEDFIRNEQ